MGLSDSASGQERQHPEWNNGWKAYQAGKKIQTNPHDYGTDANAAWDQGWQEAMEYYNKQECQ